MQETHGELFEKKTDALVITTNGTIKQDGRAVMGRGCADQARRMFHGIDVVLGQKIQQDGNRVRLLGHRRDFDAIYMPDQALVSFPVKHNWWEEADPVLIQESAQGLVLLTDQQQWKSIVLPRPGCGNGRLDWIEIKKLLIPILDDRFSVTTL